MRIKLDDNIPRSAAARLQALGHDVDTAIEEGLSGKPDHEVWTVTQADNRFLVTQDLDFSDERRFTAGKHHGILLVRLPDSEQWQLADYLAAWFSTPDATTRERCFVVATQNKVRIRRPTD